MAVATKGKTEIEAHLPRTGDFGPRLSSVERTVAVLDNDMKEVKAALQTLSTGQEKLATILLRMEAADDERQKHPRPAWWQFIAGISAAVVLIVTYVNAQNWLFEAQLQKVIPPFISRADAAQVETRYRIDGLDARLKQLEATFSWTPNLHQGVTKP